MARTQFTFTFTNAQPGSVVSFDNIDADHLYASATGSGRLGHPLVLDSSNSLSVWSDATQLTARTEDGAGNDISATATVAVPTVTSADGTAGHNPFSSGGSSPAVLYTWTYDAQPAELAGDNPLAVTAGTAPTGTPNSTDWANAVGVGDPVLCPLLAPGVYLLHLGWRAAGGTDLSGEYGYAELGIDGTTLMPLHLSPAVASSVANYAQCVVTSSAHLATIVGFTNADPASGRYGSATLIAVKIADAPA